MKTTLLAAAVLAGLGGLTAAGPVSAAPIPMSSGLGTDHGGLFEPVRMKRHRMRRSSANAGNASMPSRRPAARQYGQTTGGPRR